MSLLPEGGLLAIDWGQKKVGYATCDEEGLLVSPQGVLRRPKDSPKWRLTPFDIQSINKLLARWEPGAIVLGLPLNQNNQETSASAKMRGLGEEMKKTFNRDVHFVNEALTSWDAGENSPQEDARAAAIFLEDFIAQKKRKTSGGWISYILLAALIAGSAAAYFCHGFLMKAHKAGEGSYVVDIAPGTGFRQLFQQLEISGLNEKLAKIWLRAHSLDKTLKVGEFEIQNSWSQSTVLQHVLTKAPIYRTLTVKEGENVWDIFLTLKKTFPDLTQNDFATLITEPALLDEAGVPEHKLRNLEGFLFPETYTYQKYHTPRTLIESMIQEFDKRAMPILKKHPWASNQEGIYKLLTLASIVEKESSNLEEQPVIASVFWNRIEKGMRLQSDPTIIYPLLPNFDGNIKKAHIQMRNDYNTYMMAGLPVGPISNPGITALEAVVTPAHTPYLYFVSKNDGTHIFSEDYKTHQKYVTEYQLRRRQSSTK